MKEIYLEESKVLQMDILTAVDKFCHENNIRYSMACGTLLGAIRHGGFIPWDDDIDIYMLREDYIKFTESFPDDYLGKYSLLTRKKEPKWPCTFCKIYDNRTISVDSHSTIKTIGINIDLFPIDDVPDEDDKWADYRKYQFALRKKQSIKLARPSLNSKAGLISCIRKLCVWNSLASIVDNLDRFAQINNGKGYSRVFECACGMYCKAPFSKNLFDNIIEIPFEDRKFKAFKDSDEYLTATFGDYMQLPPVEKRVRKHESKEFWVNKD